MAARLHTAEQVAARKELIHRLFQNNRETTYSQAYAAVRKELGISCNPTDVMRAKRAAGLPVGNGGQEAKRVKRAYTKHADVQVIEKNGLEKHAEKLLVLMRADKISEMTIKSDGTIAVLRVRTDTFRLS